MNNKLIVTEAQWERLLNFINETPFDAMVKNTIKVGDTVVITWKNSKNNFKVMDNTSGHIIMDNIDSGSSNINYRYYMVYTGLSGDDLELRRVHKINEKDKLSDFKEWTPMTVKDISNIQIFRNGKQIDIVDPLSPTAEKQQKQGTKNNLGSKDVSADFTSSINEELKADGQLALKMILSDPELKAAFYTQPTFWQAFVADLRGDKPTGTGIIPTLDLLGKYGMNKIKQKIGDGFIVDNDAKYQLLKTIEIPYKTSKNTNDVYTLKVETDYIRVRRHVIEDKDQVLIKKLDDNLDLRIIVKNKTEDPDVYSCEIEIGKLKKGGNWENLTLDTVEANIRFLQSKGYKEQKQETTK